MRAIVILRSLLATAFAVLAATSTDLAAAQNCVSVAVQSSTDTNSNASANAPSSSDVSPDTPIQDGTVVTIVVKLNPKYAKNPPAEVEVSAPGLVCARSKFAFSKTKKASHTQRATCRTLTGSASASTPDGSVVDIPVTLAYKRGPRATDEQKLKRKVISSGSCSGWGDPHLTTLDGVAYDFQKQGVFKYVEAGSLQVQIFQEKCGDVARLKDAAPSCYQGVAVAFGASLARFFIVDGKLQAARASASLQWLSVERLTSTAAQGFRVFANVDHAAYVDINLSQLKDYPLINVALQLSPYFKTGIGAGAGAAAGNRTATATATAAGNPASARDVISGLMGNWNGDRNDDITDNDQLAKLHGISLDQNLFTCADATACKPLLKSWSRQDSNALAITQASPNGSQPLLHQGYAPVSLDAIPLGSFSPKLRALSLRQLGQLGRLGQRESENLRGSESESDSDMQARLLQGSAEYVAGIVAATPDGAKSNDAVRTATASTSMAVTGNNSATNVTDKPISTPISTLSSTPTPTPTTSKPNSDAATNNVVDVTPRATLLCQQVISAIATTCAKYVSDTDHHIHSRCIADAALLQDLTIVDSAKLGYLRECRRELDARLSSQTATAAETAALQKDRDALFFGDLSRCANQCSGRGKCLAAGCQCDAGYTGLGCDVKI